MHLTDPDNFWFWYVTDMDGSPLEQGEGPCDMYVDGDVHVDGAAHAGAAAAPSPPSRACAGPPKMLFHQYHPGSFAPEAFSDDDAARLFGVPRVCRATSVACEVEPTNFCGDD